MSDASVAVHIEGLSREFGGRRVLDGLNLDIRRGEFVALLGASGAGKTTLLRIIGALDRADSGTVLVPEARTIVFQEHRLLPWQRVWSNVTIGLPNSVGFIEACWACWKLGATPQPVSYNPNSLWRSGSRAARGLQRPPHRSRRARQPAP